MADDHADAIAALMKAFDDRETAPAPLVERRDADRRASSQTKLVDASRASGPVDGQFAYWDSTLARACVPSKK